MGKEEKRLLRRRDQDIGGLDARAFAPPALAFLVHCLDIAVGHRDIQGQLHATFVCHGEVGELRHELDEGTTLDFEYLFG